MLVDLHMHSNHSRCAHPDNTVQAMVEAAVNAGVDAIGITDHLHPHIDPAIFADNRAQLAKLSQEKLKVWIGVELDVTTLSGEITGNPDIYRSLDYVMAGVHHYHLDWVEGPDLTKSPTDILYFAQQNLINTIRNPWVNAIGHPWVGTFKVFKFELDLLKPEWIEEAGFEAAKHETALEIPAWALFQDDEVNEPYLRHVVRPLIKTGCPLMRGTDSHHLENIGRRIDRLTDILLQEGAAEDQLWSPAKLSINHV